jgi:serine/threonine-protein kinase RsbW
MSPRAPTLDAYSVVADREGARAAALWLEARGRQRCVPSSLVARLDQCLDEALANVIAYGGPSARASTIDLSLRVHRAADHDIAALTVSDAGTPFNPLSITGRTDARTVSLAEAEPGGLGLVMIRAFSDTQAYCFDRGRNHLTFSVLWADSA